MSAAAIALVKVALNLRLPVEGIIRNTVFTHFCGGESISQSEQTIKQIGRYGVSTILDYSVEGERSESGFDATCEEIIRTIEQAHISKDIPFCVFKVTGIASAELFEKIQRKESLTNDETLAFQRCRQRVDRISAQGVCIPNPV